MILESKDNGAKNAFTEDVDVRRFRADSWYSLIPSALDIVLATFRGDGAGGAGTLESGLGVVSISDID